LGASYLLQLIIAILGMIQPKHPLASFSIQSIGELEILAYSWLLILPSTAEVQILFLVDHWGWWMRVFSSDFAPLAWQIVARGTDLDLPL